MQMQTPTPGLIAVVEAPQMSVQFYQDMIDRGWRRSGDYMYRYVTAPSASSLKVAVTDIIW